MDKDNKHLFESYLNLDEKKKENPFKKSSPDDDDDKKPSLGSKINTGIGKVVDYATDKDNLKAGARNVKTAARGAGKAANYFLNPFNKKGAISDAKNKMETFRDYVAGSKSGDSGITDLEAVKGFRDKYVYPREHDETLNQKVLDILTIPHVPYPLQTISGDGAGPYGSDSKKVLPQIASAFGEYVFKRNRPLRSAAHIANLILDVYVLNLRKEIPPKKAMEIAIDEVIKSGALKRWLRDESGLLPADVASVSGSKK